MGGRQRRLLNFEERALAFHRDLQRNQGSKTIYREIGHTGSGLLVGVGRHKRLVFKTNPFHARQAREIHNDLAYHFLERGYGSVSYKLLNPRFVAVGTGVVQEYFNKPTLSELSVYLAMKRRKEQAERKLSRPLNVAEARELAARFMMMGKESHLRCKQFLNDPLNKGVDLPQIREVERELQQDADYLRWPIKPDNVIVLGKTREKDYVRMRIAIIDY